MSPESYDSSESSERSEGRRGALGYGSPISSQMRFGLLLQGLPKTEKYDKLLKHLTMRNKPNAFGTKVWKGTKPSKITLFSEMIDGKKMTTGSALFIFHETDALGNLSCGPHVRRANGFRLDKSHTLTAQRVLVCKTCMTDISFKFDHVSSSDCSKDQSLVCEFSCQACAPHTFCCCCAEVVMDKDIIFKSATYHACSDCSKDRVNQEKWRMAEGYNILDVETNAVIYKHLPDDLIAQEQLRMGGEPYEPMAEDSPFSYSCLIDDLLDTESLNYWPYGMSSYEYLQYRERLAFDNPTSVVPEEATYTKVTNENLEDYWRKMTDLQEKYEFESLENIGSMPTTFMKDKQEFRLIPEIHGLICDDPMCQAIAKDQDEADGGAYAALVLTSLPLFTNRTGDISESEEEAGPGQEFCLVCISK